MFKGLSNFLCKNKEHYNILVITDLHGSLYKVNDKVNDFFNDIDFVVLLGDIKYQDWDILVQNEKFLQLPKYALLGNHDDFNDINNINKTISDNNGKEIIHFNNQMINYNNLSFVGIEGSLRYKNENGPLITQNESIIQSNLLPKADIIFSHDKPKYEFDDNNNISRNAHEGLYGIFKYMLDNNCKINIHGHIHENYQKKINDILEISCYKINRVSLIKTKNWKVQINENLF